MTSKKVQVSPEIKQAATLYRTQLLQTEIPLPAAAVIALAIARFERNQGRPDSSTRQLISHYKAHICRANLWRFQLLSTTSLKRISTHLPHHP